MATLFCDRCGGKLVICASGVAVCDSCGTEHSVDRIKEKVQKLINCSQETISRSGQRFATSPNQVWANEFASDITSTLNSMTQFISQSGIVIPTSELMIPIARTINNLVLKAYQDIIFPDYNGDPYDSEDRATKYRWQTYIERIGYCTELLEKSIGLCGEDNEEDIQRYKNLIYLHEQAIDSCSWKSCYTKGWNGLVKVWDKEWSLSDAAKNARRDLIRGYEAKIAGIKAEIALKEVAEMAELQRIANEEGDYS